MNKREEQYTKIWDSLTVGLLFLGLSSELSMIINPSLALEYLILGMPCIIIGLVIIIRWDTYYGYRISTLMWLTIFLVVYFIVATIFFLLEPQNIQGKMGFYLLDVITIILLIIIFVKKRNQLSDMRG
jgi:hypothetical protein